MLSTFQTLVLSGLAGLSLLFPLGAAGLLEALSSLLRWPGLNASYMALLQLEAAVLLLFIQRHEWVSQLASFLQVLVYRKRPATMDERLPFFVLLALAPSAIFTPMLRELIPPIGATPLQTTGYPLLLGLVLSWLLVFVQYFSRKKWALYDWKWSGALFLGIGLLGNAVPGWDFITLAWILGALLQHRSDSIGRMLYWLLPWYWIVESMRTLNGQESTITAAASAQMSSLSFYTGLALAAVVLLGVARSLRGWVENNPPLKRFAVLRTCIVAGFLLKAYLESGH